MDARMRIERMLEKTVAQAAQDVCPPGLAAAVNHAVFPGGARVRPMLCLGVAAACAGAPTATSVAAAVADLISAGAGLRTCTALRRGATHHWCRTDSSGRMIGGCRAASPAPLTPTDYAARVMRARAVMFGESDDIVTAAVAEVTRLAAAEMFESAARQRDRTAAMIHTLALCQRLRALCVVGELVVARPHECGGWELSVIRHGRLAGAGVARRGVPPMPVVQALVAAAETVAPDPGPLCGAPPEEAGLIYRWITDPGARIVSATDAIALPAFGAARSLHWARLARQARR